MSASALNHGTGGFRPLHAMAFVVLACLAFAATARWTGLGVVRMPEAEVVQYRDLRFADRADGSVGVADAATGAVVAILEPGTSGFIRGVMRGRSRERKLDGFGNEQPHRLALHADGRLTLEDRATGTKIVLNSFGPTNAEAFSRFLPEKGNAK